MSRSRAAGVAERRAQPSPRRARSPWLAAALIVLTGCAADATSVAGAFVYDDIFAIVDNPHVRQLWPLTEALKAPVEATLSGRPMASLTMAMSYALAPADARAAIAAAPLGDSADRLALFARTAWSFHAGNLAIHLAAALALFGVMRRTLETAPLRERVAGAADGLALAVALIWLVHPLQTAAVTYVVQRVESQMGLCFLLTLDRAIRAGAPREQSGSLWSFLAIVCCALGMATKQVMVAAPIVVVLWDWTFRRATMADARRRLLYLGLASTWLVLVALVRLEPRANSVGFGFADWPWWRYLATQTGVVVHYLRLAFLPAPLVFNYDWPPVSHLADAAVPAAILGIAFAATAAGLVRRHAAAFAGACVFLILAPTSSVLPIVTEVAAEQRMYLLLASLVATAVVGGYLLAARRIGSRMTAAIGVPLVMTIVATLGVMTSARNRDYQSDRLLWADTVAKQPANARAHMNYGVTLVESGRLADAERSFREAERLSPQDGLVLANLGATLAQQGKFADALPILERAALIRSSDAEVQRALADSYAASGDLARALARYVRALDLRPDDVLVLNKAGRILAMAPDGGTRDATRAIAYAERAVALTGRRDVASLDTLGAALAAAGRFPDAAAVVVEAIAIARVRGDAAIVAELEGRLASYRAGRKFSGQGR